MDKLTEKKCLPCEGEAKPLANEKAKELLTELSGWELIENTEIKKHFSFTNFYRTMSFVNAIAWIANLENHHPDLMIGYNYCSISLKTHAVSGLTENDFIVAAKIDNLLS